MSVPTVTVEFYGVPRARAGRSVLTVQARTVADVLTAVTAGCPGLIELCAPDGRLAPQYMLSLDGERFLTDPAEPLQPGDRLLLLSADAGG